MPIGDAGGHGLESGLQADSLVGIQDVTNYEFKLEETEEELKQQQQKYNMRINT